LAGMGFHDYLTVTVSDVDPTLATPTINTGSDAFQSSVSGQQNTLRSAITVGKRVRAWRRGRCKWSDLWWTMFTSRSQRVVKCRTRRGKERESITDAYRYLLPMRAPNTVFRRLHSTGCKDPAPSKKGCLTHCARGLLSTLYRSSGSFTL
jgi:hypothetical protein